MGRASGCAAGTAGPPVGVCGLRADAGRRCAGGTSRRRSHESRAGRPAARHPLARSQLDNAAMKCRRSLANSLFVRFTNKRDSYGSAPRNGSGRPHADREPPDAGRCRRAPHRALRRRVAVRQPRPCAPAARCCPSTPAATTARSCCRPSTRRARRAGRMSPARPASPASRSPTSSPSSSPRGSSSSSASARTPVPASPRPSSTSTAPASTSSASTSPSTTRFRGAVLDLDGSIVARAEVALDGATGEAAVRARRRAARRLLALTADPVLGIGVGSPGVVDPHGVVRSAPNLGWTGLALQERLAAALHLPVHVANDANVAVLAEHGFGGAGDDLHPGQGRPRRRRRPPRRRPPDARQPASPRARSATSSSAPTAARAARAASTAASRPGSPCRG